MSKRSNEFYENWKKKVARLEERQAQKKTHLKQLKQNSPLNKNQSIDQKTKPTKTFIPSTSMGAESKQEYIQSSQEPQNKLLSKIKFFTIDLYRKIAQEIYFLKGEGLLGFVMFVASSIVYFCLLALGISLFVLPGCFLVSLLLLWIGLRTTANYIALAGFFVVGIGAYWAVILYYAEMNVRLYKEKHVRGVDNLEADE